MSTMEMHIQGTGQCMVTHDETGVDLYIVVVRITLFTMNFKGTSLMMRARTEGQPWKSSRHWRHMSLHLYFQQLSYSTEHKEDPVVSQQRLHVVFKPIIRSWLIVIKTNTLYSKKKVLNSSNRTVKKWFIPFFKTFFMLKWHWLLTVSFYVGNLAEECVASLNEIRTFTIDLTSSNQIQVHQLENLGKVCMVLKWFHLKRIINKHIRKVLVCGKTWRRGWDLGIAFCYLNAALERGKVKQWLLILL